MLASPLTGLVRGLANEWASLGIRVNGIAPGVFPTDLTRSLIEGTPRLAHERLYWSREGEKLGVGLGA